MSTADHRSYELEPLEIGEGLDEFAQEDERAAPSTFEIEALTQTPTPGLSDLVWEEAPMPGLSDLVEEEAPVPMIAAPVAPRTPRFARMKRWVAGGRETATHGYRGSAAAVRGAVRRGQLAISGAFLMMAVGVVGAWMALRVLIGLAFVSRVIESGRAHRRMAWESFAAQWVGTGRRGRLAISTAASMMAVAVGVVGAWMALRVPIGLAFISRVVESGRARARTAWQSLSAPWAGTSVLLHRRGTIAGLTVALLAGVLAVPSNPPAVSPVAAVSTSATTAALPAAVDVAGPKQVDPPAAAVQTAPFPASAALERPGVPAALRAAAPSSGPEVQTTVSGGTTAGLQSDTLGRQPVLLAVAERRTPITSAAEPMAVPVAIVSAALEEPKPAAAEPPAFVPAVIGTAAATVTADRSAIDDVLSAYRRSYNSLDASAVSAVWRGADTRALTRAFSSLTRQRMTFEQCDVRVTAADRARAQCEGLLSYVPKAGDTTPQQRRVSWSIDFDRTDDRWAIVGVQAR